jgi:uncharacterized protein YpmB
MFKMSQRRRGFLQALTFGALAPSVLPVAAYAQEKSDDVEISLKHVPAHLKDAATKAAPGVHWKTAFKNVEDGETTYEIEGLDRKNREVTVTITADGKVEEIETEITEADTPSVVMKALKAKFPGLQIVSVTEIQEAHKEGHKVVGFDFEASHATDDKKTVGIYVSADGKTVHVEEN